MASLPGALSGNDFDRREQGFVVDVLYVHEYHAAFSQSGEFRGIAQSGSAPALGAGCREFKSLYPDQIFA